MDRLVGPVNLQVMARLVRKLFGGDLPNEVARMIHQMIQRWVNYMNHLRRVQLRGVYARSLDEAVFNQNDTIYTRDPFEWSISDWMDGDVQLERSDPRVRDSQPNLLLQLVRRNPPANPNLGLWQENGPGWYQHGDDDGPGTQVQAYMRRRYYGPGF
jgi:hypothetical protein